MFSEEYGLKVTEITEKALYSRVKERKDNHKGYSGEMQNKIQ